MHLTFGERERCIPYLIHDNHDYLPTTTGLHKKQEIIFDFDARADVSGNGTTFFS